jgi:hypothetical protein
MNPAIEFVVCNRARLRIFADLCGRAKPETEHVLATFVTEMANSEPPAKPATAYRNLHHRLAGLPPRTTPENRRLLRPAHLPDWENFRRLRPLQQLCVYLVIGLEFSAAEAAFILNEDEDFIAMEVISALFSLEHILPFSRPPRPRAERDHYTPVARRPASALEHRRLRRRRTFAASPFGPRASQCAGPSL